MTKRRYGLLSLILEREEREKDHGSHAPDKVSKKVSSANSSPERVKLFDGRRGESLRKLLGRLFDHVARTQTQRCREKTAPFIFHSEKRCQQKHTFIDDILPSRGSDLDPNGSQEKSVKSVQTRYGEHS